MVAVDDKVTAVVAVPAEAVESDKSAPSVAVPEIFVVPNVVVPALSPVSVVVPVALSAPLSESEFIEIDPNVAVPVTLSVPAMEVFPEAAATLNLLVLTEKSFMALSAPLIVVLLANVVIPATLSDPSVVAPADSPESIDAPGTFNDPNVVVPAVRFASIDVPATLNVPESESALMLRALKVVAPVMVNAPAMVVFPVNVDGPATFSEPSVVAPATPSVSESESALKAIELKVVVPVTVSDLSVAAPAESVPAIAILVSSVEEVIAPGAIKAVVMELGAISPAVI